jgi:hypothetical protein
LGIASFTGATRTCEVSPRQIPVPAAVPSVFGAIRACSDNRAPATKGGPAVNRIAAALTGSSTPGKLPHAEARGTRRSPVLQASPRLVCNTSGDIAGASPGQRLGATPIASRTAKNVTKPHTSIPTMPAIAIQIGWSVRWPDVSMHSDLVANRETQRLASKCWMARSEKSSSSPKLRAMMAQMLVSHEYVSSPRAHRLADRWQDDRTSVGRHPRAVGLHARGPTGRTVPAVA